MNEGSPVGPKNEPHPPGKRESSSKRMSGLPSTKLKWERQTNYPLDREKVSEMAQRGLLDRKRRRPSLGVIGQGELAGVGEGD